MNTDQPNGTNGSSDSEHLPVTSSARLSLRPAADNGADVPTVQLGTPLPHTSSLDLPLSFYLFQLRRYWKLIAACVVVASGIALVAALRIPKQYESAATIRIDPENTDNLFDPARQREGLSYDIDEVLIATEMHDVSSRSVVLEAIRSARLDRLPAFAGIANSGAAPTEEGLARLLGVIQGGISVTRPEQTRNVEIHFRWTDPQTPPVVANALANALINHEYLTRVTALTNSSQWMVRQLEDLRARVEASDHALLDYQHRNQVLNPDDHVLNQRVAQLNTDLAQAEAERVRAEADERAAQSEDLDVLLASDRGAALRPAFDAWRGAENAFEAVTSRAGSANPVYIRAQRDLDRASEQLKIAEQQLYREIHASYLHAVTREQLLSAEFDRAKADLNAFNAKAIDYEMLKRDSDSNKKLYDDLLQRIKEADISAGFRSQQVRISDPAVPNGAPVYPNVSSIVLFAAAASLLLGCIVAVAAGLIDRTFTSPESLEQVLGIAFLGALPHAETKAQLTELGGFPDAAHEAALMHSRSAFAEAVLMLHTAVQFSPSANARTFCITSAQPEEGKSVATTNLALAMALHGARVLVIDGDIRRPSLHNIFGVKNHVGLSTALRRLGEVDECIIPAGPPNVFVLPAGPGIPNPAEMLGTSLADLLETVKQDYDCILLDSPPVLGFADALVISARVDTVLLIVKAGRTPKEYAHTALQRLRHVQARVQGVILNDVTSEVSPYYNYYYDQYHKYYHHRPAEKAKVG